MYKDRDSWLITVAVLISAFFLVFSAALAAHAVVQCLRHTTLDVWACLALAL